MADALTRISAKAVAVSFEPHPARILRPDSGLKLLTPTAPSKVLALWNNFHALGAKLNLPVPREPLWRLLNMARGAYWPALGNTPGHLNHWSKVGFHSLLTRYGTVQEVRTPFPWTMLLVRLG